MDASLVDRLIAQQQGRCFICDRAIDRTLDKIEVDHIIPRARGGKDDDNNYAAVHEPCNRSKSDADLRVARCLSVYELIKEDKAPEGPNRPNLGDFLVKFGGAKYPIHVDRIGEELVFTTPELNTNRRTVGVNRDKLSGLDYAFLHVPLEYIHHDSRINPRAVSSRIRGLLTEFLSAHPQLHVGLAWAKLESNQMEVRVFDGQHKIVAQMLLGVRMFPLRVFIDPDLNLLLETNTHAGTTLRQIAFDQVTQRFLGSQLYLEKIEEFRKTTGRSDDDLSFSEQDLVTFFKGDRREVARYVLDDVRIGVIHHPENRLKDFIEFSGREGEKPLSYETIQRTAFSLFIRKTPLSLPLNHRLEVGENFRQLEKEQIVRLLNVLADQMFIGKFDFDLGARQTENRIRKAEIIPEPHLRAVRLAREEIFYNVMRYVRDLVKRFFLMGGEVVEDSELFGRGFPEELWSLIAKLVKNLAELPVWVNKQLSGTVFGGKQDYEYWKIIFETGRDRSGIQVLARPLNLDELIR